MKLKHEISYNFLEHAAYHCAVSLRGSTIYKIKTYWSSNGLIFPLVKGLPTLFPLNNITQFT